MEGSCGHWGLSATACTAPKCSALKRGSPTHMASESIHVRCTTQLKNGIVESGVNDVKKSFVPLREFRHLADANQQLRE